MIKKFTRCWRKDDKEFPSVFGVKDKYALKLLKSRKIKLSKKKRKKLKKIKKKEASKILEKNGWKWEEYKDNNWEVYLKSKKLYDNFIRLGIRL